MPPTTIEPEVTSTTRPNVELMLDVIGQSTGLAYGVLVDKAALERVSAGDPVKCENVGHCAMGELLHKAGVPNHTLSILPGSPSSIGGGWPIELHQLLFDVYQIDRTDVRAIITANDSVAGSGSYNDPRVATDLRERAVMERIRAMGSDGRQRRRPQTYEWEP